MHVVIAAPIRDRAWALPSWFAALGQASARFTKKPSNRVSFVFLENDSSDGTWFFLAGAAMASAKVSLIKHDFGYAHYKVPMKERQQSLADGEKANPKNDKRELAILRNMLVDAFLETDGDYLVMWDSDVWMPSEALSGHRGSLISEMEANPTIGTLCADVQHPHCHGRYHNALVANDRGQLYHPDWSAVQNERWNTIMSVDTTGGGGAVIIRRGCLQQPVSARYGPHVQGEDVSLCRTIQKAGFKVAFYRGVRGLHLSRALFEQHADDGSVEQHPFGDWVEDWIKNKS